MPNLEEFVELHDSSNEDIFGLQFQIEGRLADDALHVRIRNSIQFHRWEEVSK